jgi:hypothetical protein
MKKLISFILITLFLCFGLSKITTAGYSDNSSLVVGGSPIVGGTNGNCLSISSGILGNMACSTGTLTVGTSAIASGTNGYLLYDNVGVLGNEAVSSLSLTFSQISGTVPINQGGTGQITANAALNALLPSQGGNSGLFLTTNGTNTTWAAAGGGALTSRASAWLNATTSITAGAFNLVPFDTLFSGFGSTSEFDIVTHKGRFTSTNGGIYQVNALIGCAGTSITGYSWVTIYKNGSTIISGQLGIPLSSTTEQATINTTVPMNAGDYIEIYYYPTNGTGLTLEHGNPNTGGNAEPIWVQIVQIQ